MFDSFLSFKRTTDLKPGELIRIGNATSSHLAIVAAPDPARSNTGYFMLEPFGPVLAFTLIASLRQGFVASYGTEFIIEPMSYEGSWVGNAAMTEVHGLLRLTADGTVIQGKPKSEYEEVFQFELTSGEVVPTSYQESIPIFSWRVWANERHRSTLAATPLMTFVATEVGEIDE